MKISIGKSREPLKIRIFIEIQEANKIKRFCFIISSVGAVPRGFFKMRLFRLCGDRVIYFKKTLSPPVQ